MLERTDIQRPSVHRHQAAMARDVRRGLTQKPRSVPAKYFYDEVGSALFDEICEQPEYYVTRAERKMLELHAVDIIDCTAATELIELGSGMARKTSPLLGAIARKTAAPRYVPFDIAPSAIEASARELTERHPTLLVRGIVGDFEHDLGKLRASSEQPSPRLIAFLGSTIGNLDEIEAPALLQRIRAQMSTTDWFLLGVDLVKPSALLHAAYNDAAGVTARFNLNLLTVINRELDADFDVGCWVHRAHFNAQLARIEMHLEASRGQRVGIRGLDLEIDFAAGERILTEISRKFTPHSIEATLGQAGLHLEKLYVGARDEFALVLARPR